MSGAATGGPLTTPSCAGFMTKAPSRRLGVCGGAAGIKAHAFFRDVDWDALAQRKLRPPFRPKVRRVAGEGSAAEGALCQLCFRLQKSKREAVNFDAEFTKEEPVLTPVAPDVLRTINQVLAPSNSSGPCKLRFIYPTCNCMLSLLSTFTF